MMIRNVGFGQLLVSAVSFAFAVTLLVGFGILGLQVGDRSLPVILLAEPELETPSVKAGEDARVRIKFVVQKYCPTHVDTFLFDSSDALIKQESMDFVSGQAEPNKPSDIVYPIPTPIDMKGGKTTYRALTTYRCNWIQNWWPLHAPAFELHWKTIAVPPEEIEQRVQDELKQLLLETPK